MQKNLFIKNLKDNFQLYGELSSFGIDDSIVILCHGLFGNLHENGAFDLMVEQLNKNKIDSFRFDFRSCGRSEGADLDLSISGEISDLESIILYLKNIGYNKFILLGASFGASIVSLIDNVIFNSDIKKIILWYGALDYMDSSNKAFTSEKYKIAKKNGYYERTKKDGRKFKYSLQLFNEVYFFKPYKALLQKKVPLLFVHGEKDETIPFKLSENIHKMCSNSYFKLIPELGHCFKNSEEYKKAAIMETLEFIKK